jgi:hypothetical protein
MHVYEHLRKRAGLSSRAGADRASETLYRGLATVAGRVRVLVYDLAPQDAPLRLSRTGITLSGSERWQSYLARRRSFDDGQLTLVVALRRLNRTERLLAVDWGTAHANAFLLIEPIDAEVDLSNTDRDESRRLYSAAEKGSAAEVESILRGLYGAWVYWPAAPATEEDECLATLPLFESRTTLFEALQSALRDVFPPQAFLEQLRRLLRDESELFHGRTIERASTPFRTRLGLPAVYDPTLVTVAVRDLVNEGRIAAFPSAGSGYFQGPALPVPDEVPNELFERMLL